MKFFQKAAWKVGSNTILINYIYEIYNLKLYNIFLLYFCEKKCLAVVLLTHAEEKWLCRISSFYEKRKTKQLKQNFFKTVETYGFCNLQTKKCEKISTTRLRHVNYLHSSSIYPHESKNKTEKGRKSKVKIIATITR